MKYLILVFVVCLVGCEPPTKEEMMRIKERQQEEQKRVEEAEDNWLKSNLPPTHTNFIPLRNGWCTFELEGKKYLYHKESREWNSGDRGYGIGYESITEITPTKKEGAIDSH